MPNVSGLAALLGSIQSPANIQAAQSTPLFGTVSALAPLQIIVDGATTAVSAQAPLEVKRAMQPGTRVMGLRVGAQFYVLASFGDVPFARMERSVTSLTIPANSETSIPFNHPILTPSGYSTLVGGMLWENSRMCKVPISGWYHMTGGIQTASHGGGRTFLTFGFDNGAGIADGSAAYTNYDDVIYDSTTTATGSVGASISLTRYMNAGDRVALRLSSSIATTVVNFANLSVELRRAGF